MPPSARGWPPTAGEARDCGRRASSANAAHANAGSRSASAPTPNSALGGGSSRRSGCQPRIRPCRMPPSARGWPPTAGQARDCGRRASSANAAHANAGSRSASAPTPNSALGGGSSRRSGCQPRIRPCRMPPSARGWPPTAGQARDCGRRASSANAAHANTGSRSASAPTPNSALGGGSSRRSGCQPRRVWAQRALLRVAGPRSPQGGCRCLVDARPCLLSTVYCLPPS
jgi:hypothetical protein